MIFYLGKIFKAISQNAVQTLAPGAAFLFAYEGDLMTRIALGLTLFCVIVISLAFIRYWFFRYQIGADSILIREGVLTSGIGSSFSLDEVVAAVQAAEVSGRDGKVLINIAAN